MLLKSPSKKVLMSESSNQKILLLALMLLNKINLLLTRYKFWTPMAQNTSPKSLLMGFQLTKALQVVLSP